MNNVTYSPIGVVHSPYKEPKNMPIQTIACKGIKGTVEVFPKYVEGLKDLEGFSYIILLCHLNLAKEYSLIVKPFLDDKVHGVFATRSPSRPNPIGLSIVRLTKIEQGILFIENLDIVDNTPLLDIKPLVPAFDNRRTNRIGWLKGKIDNMPSKISDTRFSN
jgi:tRNA-Thr(GGU) m(6)t(6)A37 methyltransferase TsaA